MLNQSAHVAYPVTQGISNCQRSLWYFPARVDYLVSWFPRHSVFLVRDAITFAGSGTASVTPSTYQCFRTEYSRLGSNQHPLPSEGSALPVALREQNGLSAILRNCQLLFLMCYTTSEVPVWQVHRLFVVGVDRCYLSAVLITNLQVLSLLGQTSGIHATCHRLPLRSRHCLIMRRGGIEPPTLALSELHSTGELPAHEPLSAFLRRHQIVVRLDARQ